MNLQVAPVYIPEYLIDHVRSIKRARVDAAVRQLRYLGGQHSFKDRNAVKVRADAVRQLREGYEDHRFRVPSAALDVPP